MRTLITTKGSFSEPDTRTVKERLAVCGEEGFWLDISAPADEDFDILRDAFGFHPLAIEDVRNQNQRPKLEEYKGYAFMVLFQGQMGGDGGGTLVLREHHLFIATDYLVTVHVEPAPILDQLRERISRDPAVTRESPGFLTYLVVSELVDGLFPVLESFDERIDTLEDRIVDSASPELLSQIYRMKHDVIALRRVLGAQRDLFQRLISHSIDSRDHDVQLYWRDVYDHMVRQYESVDSLRDLLTGAMDVYLSTVSNRLNATMKTLTVIASVFLPISFLTGFYGMNFSLLTQTLEMPWWALLVGVATMLASVGIQLFLFHRRGWI